MGKKDQIFCHGEEKISDPFLESIGKACEGLVYVSETDSAVLPFKVSTAGPDVAKTILEHAGMDSNAPVDVVSFDAFFDRLTVEKDWHGEREKKRAKKFLELEKLLKEYLRDLKVYRLGKIRIGIYAAGIDRNGCLAGIRTEAVET